MDREDPSEELELTMRPTRETLSPLGVLEALRDAPVAPRCAAIDPRAGFVLALVVLLLFAIGIAGAAGYQVVLNEALLAIHAKETQRALSIARAGLQRYVANEVGVHEDTVTYSIEGGNAVVTARLVAEIDDFETLYLLGSEGVYTDPTFTGSAARRTVYQWANKREVALDHLAEVTQASGNVYVRTNAHVDGDDRASSGECAQTSTDIIGVLRGSGSLTIEGGSPIDGNPNTTAYGSYDAVMDSLGIDWSLLTDSNFPVDYENTWPSCALPSDSFTVTRFTGNLWAPSTACGRGVLIVTGDLTPANGFSWDGIVLAGYMVSTFNNFTIEGLVVGGLDGMGVQTNYNNDTHLHYDRCKAFQAGKRLSHFQPVGST